MKSSKPNLQPNYGNWVPIRLLFMLLAVTLLFAVLLILSFVNTWTWPWTALIVALIAISTGFLCYMCLLFRTFSFSGGRLMGKVHEHLVSRLNWDGHGRLLDVGCGAGALTIRCAKKFPEALCTGIDYWGIKWDYSQQMCQHNAEVENVANRCTFQHGDANHLDFNDETFDAVVSNFVYHEINDGKGREQLLRETLRVLRKGGCFALQDLFGQRTFYGDVHKIIDSLRVDAVAEIHYHNSAKEIPIPSWMQMPGMMSGVGIIYGIK